MTDTVAATEELEREKFERWFEKHYRHPSQFYRYEHSGDYASYLVRAAWRSWQARAMEGK